MKVGRVLICALLVLGNFQFLVPTASATVSNTIVISHIVGGETGHQGSELIALYNNTNSDIDITGYCVKDGLLAATNLACIQADVNTRVFIRAHNYLTIASNVFIAQHPMYIADTVYTSPDSNASKIIINGDTITLADAENNEVDQVAWTSSGTKLETNISFQRKEAGPGSGVKVDTDLVSADFESVVLTTPLNVPVNATYDVVTYIDVCPNLDDVQPAMPLNYLADESGECQPDSCLNLPGLQTSVLDGYDANDEGICTLHDECDNIAGVQTDIPVYMERSGVNECDWEIPQLMLTEILPNAIGSDTNNEFIEIYNPTDQVIDLGFYIIKTGVGLDKAYSFPIGTTISPGEYRTFSDNMMKFTLINTSSRVVLNAIDMSILGDSGIYDSPVEGESWALIEGVWQYTNQPTPGAANRVSIIEEVIEDSTDTGTAPCPAGKYRHPLTNRCRNITEDASVFASCDADQYRNPETGRCRKITTTTLALCKDGQYRSEETNRCRNISAASGSKPCKDNQYRSEETNRCRNMPAGSVPDAAFAVQPIKDTGTAFVGWWALGGISLLAVGYALWEWRHEVTSWMKLVFKR